VCTNLYQAFQCNPLAVADPAGEAPVMALIVAAGVLAVLIAILVTQYVAPAAVRAMNMARIARVRMRLTTLKAGCDVCSDPNAVDLIRRANIQLDIAAAAVRTYGTPGHASALTNADARIAIARQLMLEAAQSLADKIACTAEQGGLGDVKDVIKQIMDEMNTQQ